MTKTTEQATVTAEHRAYLNTLRKTGETNMYGAAPYLQMEFGMTKYEARAVLMAWMNGFGKEEA